MSIKLTRKNCIFTPRFWKQLLKVGNVERRAIEMKLTAILDENTPANIRKLTASKRCLLKVFSSYDAHTGRCSSPFQNHHEDWRERALLCGIEDKERCGRSVQICKGKECSFDPPRRRIQHHLRRWHSGSTHCQSCSRSSDDRKYYNHGGSRKIPRRPHQRTRRKGSRSFAIDRNPRNHRRCNLRQCRTGIRRNVDLIICGISGSI